MNTPDTEWEKEFNARMIVVLDDGTEEYVWKPEVMREYIQSLLTSRDTYWKERVEETKKAFGGCTKCYGKGYATVLDYYTAHADFVGDKTSTTQNNLMRFCTCERGTQLDTLLDNLK